MAREHARIQTAIWIDDDFLDLSRDAQHLYFVMTTQMSLSFCGVTNWHAGRVSQLAAGWTVEEVEEAAAELSERLYLIFDETTGEVLVRSFIRNDGFMNSPNIVKAMYRTYAEIGSRILRGVVVHELKRLHSEQPNLKGWEICGELLSKQARNPSELVPFTPSGTLSNPSGNPSVNPSPAPYSLLPSPNSQTPDSPPKSGYPADFQAAWELYPLKRDKKAAYKAYQKAAKEVSPEELQAGIVRYRDDPNREPQFTKHFSTWLNAGSWDDEPIPAKTGQQRTTHSERVNSAHDQLIAKLAGQTDIYEIGA